jgi:hypothetical protein
MSIISYHILVCGVGGTNADTDTIYAHLSGSVGYEQMTRHAEKGAQPLQCTEACTLMSSMALSFLGSTVLLFIMPPPNRPPPPIDMPMPPPMLSPEAGAAVMPADVYDQAQW